MNSKTKNVLLIILMLSPFELFSQDAAYAVESIDISVATKRYVTFGFNYRIVKANSRYELFQVRSFVLPSADFSNFEFFATLDSFFVANKSEFFKKLTTGFFDQNISRAGLDRTNIERFYGVRLLEKINNINSTDTMFVDSIDSKSINELYLALSDIKTQDEISSVIDRSGIDKNWITDKTSLINEYLGNCKAATKECINIISNRDVLNHVALMLVTENYMHILGESSVEMKFVSRDGQSLLAVTKGNGMFMLPIVVDNRLNSYEPKLSRSMGSILPKNNDEVLDRLLGKQFEKEFMKTAVSLFCEDCK